MLVDLTTIVGNVRMSTPLMAVSGTFGAKYAELMGTCEGLGAIVTKTVTPSRRTGNPVPRIVEIEAGLLNSIGLQNGGVDAFLRDELPEYRNFAMPIIVSVAGATVDEYVYCAEQVAAHEEVAGIELNVSCPNVAKGGLSFGCECGVVEKLVSQVRRAVGDRVTLITKLTPNVTDIAEPAKAAIAGGTTAISLINTLRGMVIDIHTQQPTLGNKIGGVSGPVVKPVAVYMVARCYESCCRQEQVPIIGMGGVTCAADAIEMLLAGATAVGIGTALFHNPDVFAQTAQGLRDYLEKRSEGTVGGLVGKAISSWKRKEWMSEG
jgi:dihydroorotate dehydrogenase (NAD+) catalytic subunit